MLSPFLRPTRPAGPRLRRDTRPPRLPKYLWTEISYGPQYISTPGFCIVARRSRGIPSSGWPAYLFAASAMAVSLLTGLALHPWFDLQGYLFFVPGIVFVARWGGFGPGLLSTLLAAAAVNAFLPPARGVAPSLTADRLATILLFIGIGGII